MGNTNLENLNRLAKLFGTDRLISPEDIGAIRDTLIGVLANNKKELESLTDETKQAVNAVLDKVLTEHDTYLEKTKQMAQEVKSDVAEAIKTAKEDFAEVKRLAKEVMDSKPKDGVDADEEYVISEVLNKIKLPEYKEVVLDDGGAIVDKINSLPVNEENQIDAKHIKNLPEGKGGRVISGGVTRKIVQQMIDQSGAAGIDLEVEGTPNIDQGKLNLLGGTNMTITDNGDGSVTFDATGGGGGGSGDVVGPASATDNAIVRYDGTTGKLIQNSAATIADTSGNITAGTYNGNTIGAGSTSGTNTGDQTITLTGGVTGSGTGSFAATVVTNANLTGVVTSTGNATAIADAALSIAKTSGLQTALDAKQATITFGTGVQTALGVNVGSAGAPVLFNGALGTPSSGTVTNLTGTASININGTVGATTPTTGSFTTVTTSGNIELGNASDTTLSRSAAGQLAVEGVDVLTTSNTKTVTNKTIQAPLIDYVIEPGSDDTYEGEATNDLNAGDTIAQWDLVYLDSTSGRWEFADADAAATSGGVLLALAAASGTDGNAMNVVFRGVVRNDGWTWSGAGKPLYVSTTAGGMTETAPSGASDVIRVVGYTLSDDAIYFNPDNAWVVHS